MSPEQRESSLGMSHNGTGHERRRVVIVGGGFGGYEAAHRLKRADVDVTVVDRRNHHLFQPLIYQVAAGALSAGDVAAPVRAMLKRQPNASVLMAEVTDIDVDRREVVLERGERLSYDSLIVACGARTSYFGHDEWREVSCGLKTLEDALDLRNRIFGAFEEAERDPGARDEWLTFVVVGGGPTGVEVSGQLAILARHTMKRDFRRIDPRVARVILLDAGERVVAAFTESTSAKAAKALADLGVTVREHAMVTDIDSRGVTVKIGEKTERIVSRTVVWAAGVSAEGVAEIVARGAGAGTDRAGRIEVNPDLTLPGHPEISVIGDAAKLDGPDGKPLPGPGDGGDPAGPARCRGDPRPGSRRVQALQVLRQGGAGGGRPRQGRVRGERRPTFRLDRLPHVPRRPPVLPGRSRRPAVDRVHHGAGIGVRGSGAPRDGGAVGRGRATGPDGPGRPLTAGRAPRWRTI